MTTVDCTTCDGEGVIAGGERGEVMEPCPVCNSQEHMSQDGLPKYDNIRTAFGPDAVITDKLIISDQLWRIELLLSNILAELRKPKDEDFPL